MNGLLVSPDRSEARTEVWAVKCIALFFQHLPEHGVFCDWSRLDARFAASAILCLYENLGGYPPTSGRPGVIVLVS